MMEIPADSPHRGPRLRLREVPTGLVSRSTVLLGEVLLGIGVALIIAWASGAARGSAAWVPLVVGAGFVVVGLAFAVSRESFELDWSRRTWETRKLRGTFDDFEAVVLSEHRRSPLTWPNRFWLVSLALRGRPAVIDLFLFSRRSSAEEKLRDLADKMVLPTRLEVFDSDPLVRRVR